MLTNCAKNILMAPELFQQKQAHIGTLLLRKMMYIVYLTVLSIVVGVVRNADVHALRDDVTTSKLTLFLISQ
jgi:hypothetical protein